MEVKPSLTQKSMPFPIKVLVKGKICYKKTIPHFVKNGDEFVFLVTLFFKLVVYFLQTPNNTKKSGGKRYLGIN